MAKTTRNRENTSRPARSMRGILDSIAQSHDFHKEKFAATIIKLSANIPDLPTYEIGIYQGIPYGLLWGAKTHFSQGPGITIDSSIDLIGGLEDAGLKVTRQAFDLRKQTERLVYCEKEDNQSRIVQLLGSVNYDHPMAVRLLQNGVSAITAVGAAYQPLLEETIREYDKRIPSGAMVLSTKKDCLPGYVLVANGLLKGERHYIQKKS